MVKHTVVGGCEAADLSSFRHCLLAPRIKLGLAELPVYEVTFD